MAARAKLQAGGEGAALLGILRVVDALVRGEVVTTARIAELAGVGDKQANKHSRYIAATVAGATKRADGLHLARSALGALQSRDAVVAASLMSGVARLFDGSKFGAAMGEVMDAVLRDASAPGPADDYRRKFLFTTRGGDPSIVNRPRLLDTIVQAVQEQRKLRLAYEKFDGQRIEGVVEPLSVLLHDHQLYLIVREPGEPIRKPRRIARIRDATLLSETFEYPPTSAYNPDAALRSVWGVFLGIEQPEADIDVRFSEKFRAFARTHHWHPTQIVVSETPLVVRFHLRPCPEFYAWVLGLGDDAEVLSPAPVREECARQVRGLAQVYGVQLTAAAKMPAPRAKRPAPKPPAGRGSRSR